MPHENMPVGVSPHLIVNGAAKAIEFYKAAFGAQELRRVPAEDGVRLMHAELSLDGTLIYLCDDFPSLPVEDRARPNPQGHPHHAAPLRAQLRRGRRAGSAAAPKSSCPRRPVLGRPLRPDRRPLRPFVVAGHALAKG